MDQHNVPVVRISPFQDEMVIGQIKNLIEPLHASVIDKVIFTGVTTQRWRRADFVVDRQGVIRVHPQLARIVVTKALLPDGVIRDEINAYVDLLKRLGGKSLKPAIQQSFNV